MQIMFQLIKMLIPMALQNSVVTNNDDRRVGEEFATTIAVCGGIHHIESICMHMGRLIITWLTF